MRASLLMIGAAFAVSVLAGVGARGAEPSPPRGDVLFENRCARCHGLGGDGGDGLAPVLKGVYGRAIASRTDFFYSDALKAKGGSWTPEKLDDYLADPQRFAPGVDMDVISPDPAERAAVIGYLATLG